MQVSGSSRGSRTPSRPLLPPTSMKTKIVCTLGPASIPKIEELVMAGMDVCRLNFSHGTHEQHQNTFELIRTISKKYSHQVAVLCDIQGPKIRTGRVAEPLIIAIGDKIKVTPDKIIGTPDIIQIKYATMLDDLVPGDTIFITDGIIKLRVETCVKEERYLICEVEAGGLISDHKGCNIPSGNISLDVLQPKDREDLVLIAKLNPEFIAASFVGTAADILKIRHALKDLGNEDIKIIAKIERPVALENIDAIIEASDGIMVARGDLGVEIDTWDVPFAQKMIVKKCNKEGKPVIVATQMLETMTSVPRPTRAEASDVYNAVLDGADAVMLSGETSIGKYPVQAVKVMDRIVERAEASMPRRDPDDFDSSRQAVLETAGHGVYTLAKEFTEIGYSGCILVISNSPDSTRMVSKYRPMLGTILLSHNLRTVREMALFWGVRALYEEGLDGDLETGVATAIHRCVESGLLKKEDHVIVVVDTNLPGKHGHMPGIFTGIFDVERVVDA